MTSFTIRLKQSHVSSNSSHIFSQLINELLVKMWKMTISVSSSNILFLCKTWRRSVSCPRTETRICSHSTSWQQRTETFCVTKIVLELIQYMTINPCSSEDVLVSVWVFNKTAVRHWWCSDVNFSHAGVKVANLIYFYSFFCFCFYQMEVICIFVLFNLSSLFKLCLLSCSGSSQPFPSLFVAQI